MPDGFYLDPDGLAAATKKINDAGTILGGKLLKLKNVLDQHDGCWGTDDVGQAFAKNYVDGANNIKQGADDASQNMISLAENLNDAAKELEAVDEEQAAAMDASSTEG